MLFVRKYAGCADTACSSRTVSVRPQWLAELSKLKTSAKLAGPNAFNALEFVEDMTGSNPQSGIIGYARVSTYGQTLDAQLEQLKTAGCAKVYREKATGAKIERGEL